jgi:hypothetical protein
MVFEEAAYVQYRLDRVEEMAKSYIPNPRF